MQQEIKSNAFTDDGRLPQAEYAIKNVSKAGTILGLACRDGVVLVGINPVLATGIEKIYQLNDTTYCAVAGVFGDALRLVKYGRLESANIKENINRVPKISTLCNAIAEEKQKYTQRVSARPFGVSFLYCGYEDGEYVLYSTDPSGTVNRWRAWSFGTDEDAINGCIRSELSDDLQSIEEGVSTLFRIMSQARENPPNVAERTEVLVYQKESVKFLQTSEIENVIRRAEMSIKGQ